MTEWLIPLSVLVGAAVLTGVVLSLVSSGFWRVDRRLRQISRDEPFAAQGGNADERDEYFPTVNALLEQAGGYGVMETQLARAGLAWRPAEYLLAWGGGGVVVAAFGWLLLGPLAALAGLLLAVAGGWMTLAILQQHRLSLFERQVADALMLMASSLRSGYGILRAIQAIRDEMKPPISQEFAKVLDETNVGIGIPIAMSNLAQRVPLPDLDIAVTAVLIQLEVGGNLAEVLEIVANTVRERQRIRDEVDTLTVEGKMSGIVLFILPIIMAIVLVFLNPTYIAVLFGTSIGHLLLVCAGICQLIGGFVIHRMLQVDF